MAKTSAQLVAKIYIDHDRQPKAVDHLLLEELQDLQAMKRILAWQRLILWIWALMYLECALNELVKTPTASCKKLWQVRNEWKLLERTTNLTQHVPKKTRKEKGWSRWYLLLTWTVQRLLRLYKSLKMLYKCLNRRQPLDRSHQRRFRGNA